MGDRAGWSDYNSGGFDTFVASSDLNALASGTAAANYKMGAAIDNTAGSGHGWFYGDLEIVFRDGSSVDTTVTTGSGAPYLDVYLLPSPDGGTRYPTTNGATGGAGPTQIGLRKKRWPLPASTAIGVILVPGLTLPAGYFKGMINWVGGVSFPSNNNCLCRLKRYGDRGNLT